jgi:hypothetical protein
MNKCKSCGVSIGWTVIDPMDADDLARHGNAGYIFIVGRYLCVAILAMVFGFAFGSWWTMPHAIPPIAKDK